MPAQQPAQPPRINWTCPQCSIEIPVRVFPVYCQCGHVDRGEAKPGRFKEDEVKRREAICESCEHFLGHKCDLICVRSQGPEKWEQAVRNGRCPAKRWRKPKAPEEAPTLSEGMTWQYGVTTCPQRIQNGLLEQTLNSLAEAGFPEPRVFIDGSFRNLPAWLRDRPITERAPKMLVAPHWCMSFFELYYREPEADRYALFQDDFVMVRNMRQYLDQVKYPDKGYWNLQTFPVNASDKVRKGKTGFYPSNQRGKSAIALVFNQEAAQKLILAPRLVNRLHGKRRQILIDGGVVDALSRDAGWKEYVHFPSPTYHTGHKSSWRNATFPAADSFPGEEFDALDWLKN